MNTNITYEEFVKEVMNVTYARYGYDRNLCIDLLPSLYSKGESISEAANEIIVDSQSWEM